MWLHQDDESSSDDSFDSIPPPPPPFPPPVSRHNSRTTAHIVTRAATLEEELEIRMTPVLERVSSRKNSANKINNGISSVKMQPHRAPLGKLTLDATVANSKETTGMGVRSHKPLSHSKTSSLKETAPPSITTTNNNNTRPDSRASTGTSSSSLTSGPAGQQIGLDLHATPSFEPVFVSVLPDDDNVGKDVPATDSSNAPTKSTAKAGGAGERIPSCCQERGVLLVISTVVLFFVAVGITIGLTMHLRGNNNDGITSNRAALNAIGRNLPPETLVAIKSKTLTSPQKDALFWLLHNDTYSYNIIDQKNNEYAEFHFVQRFILATLFMALDGNNWTNKTNWMTGVDICNWHGIECFGSSSSSDAEAIADTSNEANVIRALILPNNQLRGSLPPEIVGLVRLENMEIFSNDIVGTIPPRLFEMTMLKTLFLDENHITGTLSTMIGSLINLEKLTLNRNELVGDIPTEIKKMKNLSMLWLFDNEGITGPIPSVIGQLSNMQSLALFNTGISGTIPDFSNLQKLEVFKVENCDLTGNGFNSLYDIPSLKVLGVAGNNITGSLDGIDRLVNLEELYISQTLISGPLPPGIGNLTHLKYIKSSEAALTGAIPASFGNLRNLAEIDLSMNRLTGMIPSELGQLTKVYQFDVLGNSLTGTVPYELGNLNLMESMDLRNNILSGNVPDGLCIEGAIIQVNCSVTCPMGCCTNYEC